MPSDPLDLLAGSLSILDARIRVVRRSALRVAGGAVTQDLIAGYAPGAASSDWDVSVLGPPGLVVALGRAEPAPIHAAAGVQQFVSYRLGCGWEGLRIWDRMGWAFEERDRVAPPCDCDPFGGAWAFSDAGVLRLTVMARATALPGAAG